MLLLGSMKLAIDVLQFPNQGSTLHQPMSGLGRCEGFTQLGLIPNAHFLKRGRESLLGHVGAL